MLLLSGTVVKKLINFFGNSCNRGRIRVGGLHKMRGRSFFFFSFINTLFPKNKSRHTRTSLREDIILILEKSSFEQSTRLSG